MPNTNELHNEWLKLYEQCVDAMDGYKYKDLDGFEETFKEHIIAGLIPKQKHGTKLNLTEVSNLTDAAANHALIKSRIAFKERCDLNAINDAIREGGSNLIPSEKYLEIGDNTYKARFMNVFVGFPIYRLSVTEIKFIVDQFDSELVELDYENWFMTVKTFELHLEDIDPTPEEIAVLDGMARTGIPTLISHVANSNYKIDWKELILATKNKVAHIVRQKLGKHRQKKEVMDTEAIESLFTD